MIIYQDREYAGSEVLTKALFPALDDSRGLQPRQLIIVGVQGHVKVTELLNHPRIHAYMELLRAGGEEAI